MLLRKIGVGILCIAVIGCSDKEFVATPLADDASLSLTNQLKAAIVSATNEDPARLVLPQSDSLTLIPQDPNNQLSDAKVALGKLLFHDTAFSTAGRSSQTGTWSCATCHHAAAGFKSGVPQGIGEGGVGFGTDGHKRVLADGFDADVEDEDPAKPDLQPLASPTILNSAYQDVMLWNGQFGNAGSGIVNALIPDSILMTPDTPKVSNELGLSGLETQAIAGQDVHRLAIDEQSILLSNNDYKALYESAFSGSTDSVNVNAGKAIAAYERTVLAHEAPFQKWLRGNHSAMSDAQLRGGLVFFGKGNCASCHQGPAFSSKVGASENELFMAIGLNDFDSVGNASIHGTVGDNDKKGRGGFTGEESDNLKFKIPQLYNLADSAVFGHGASFTSIRAVLDYKNAAVAQKRTSQHLLDDRFVPLGLTASELDDLEAFLTDALYDPHLMRYQPDSVPSGTCVVVDPLILNDGFVCGDS